MWNPTSFASSSRVTTIGKGKRLARHEVATVSGTPMQRRLQAGGDGNVQQARLRLYKNRELLCPFVAFTSQGRVQSDQPVLDGWKPVEHRPDKSKERTARLHLSEIVAQLP